MFDFKTTAHLNIWSSSWSFRWLTSQEHETVAQRNRNTTEATSRSPRHLSTISSRN